MSTPLDAPSGRQEVLAPFPTEGVKWYAGSQPGSLTADCGSSLDAARQLATRLADSGYVGALGKMREVGTGQWRYSLTYHDTLEEDTPYHTITVRLHRPANTPLPVEIWVRKGGAEAGEPWELLTHDGRDQWPYGQQPTEMLLNRYAPNRFRIWPSLRAA